MDEDLIDESEGQQGFEDYVPTDRNKSVQQLRNYYNYFILRTPKQS